VGEDQAVELILVMVVVMVEIVQPATCYVVEVGALVDMLALAEAEVGMVVVHYIILHKAPRHQVAVAAEALRSIGHIGQQELEVQQPPTAPEAAAAEELGY